MFLVHGESRENPDMVEFSESKPVWICCNRKRWIQSYGSRCALKPRSIYEMSNAEPLTCGGLVCAIHKPKKPMKGMLMGPVNHPACLSYGRSASIRNLAGRLPGDWDERQRSGESGHG